MILRDDTQSSHLCPFTQILALAISDHALVDVQRVEDLDGYRPPPGQPFVTIPVREHMRDVPLLRSSSDRSGVDSHQTWRYHYLHGLLRSLGSRAGYSVRLLPYNFRRGHGNVLDRKRTRPILVLQLLIGFQQSSFLLSDDVNRWAMTAMTRSYHISRMSLVSTRRA